MVAGSLCLWLRVAAGSARQERLLWRSPRRVDSAACPGQRPGPSPGTNSPQDCLSPDSVLGPGSRRKTRFVRCALCAQTVATSQLTKRAARADPRPALLAAPEGAPAGHRRPRVPSVGLCRGRQHCCCECVSGQAAACLWSAEKRRARGLARSANRHLTRRNCLSAVSAANEASFATGPRDRASQGSRSEAETATAARCGLPGRAFAARNLANKTPAHASHSALRSNTGSGCLACPKRGKQFSNPRV